MSVPYQAPYQLTAGIDEFPADELFLLPVCTTRQRLFRLLSALNAYRNLSNDRDLDYQIDVLNALAYIGRPTEAPCYPTQTVDCVAYPPTSTRFSYAPTRPNEPDIPGGYTKNPFYEVTGDNITDLLLQFAGIQLGDVLTDITIFQASLLEIPAFLVGIVQQGLPRLRIPFRGIGQVEIEFIKIPQGGWAYITQDGNPTTAEWLDLTSIGIIEILTIIDVFNDLVAGEGVIDTQVVEVNFETGGEHFIDVTFIPKIGTDVLVGYGGGIREIRLCGEEEQCDCEGEGDMPYRLRQNPDNDCQLQQSDDNGLTWSLAFDYSLCVPEVNNITNYYVRKQYNQNIVNEYNNVYDNDVTNININAPVTIWNEKSDESLCAAAREFVGMLAADKAIGIGVVTGVGFAIVGAVTGLTGGWGAPAAIAVVTSFFGLTGVTVAAAINALKDTSALDDVACCLKDALMGAPVSQATFGSALNGCSFPVGSNAEIARSLIAVELAANWLGFVDAVGTADTLIDAGLSLDCPCVEPDVEIQLNVPAGYLYYIEQTAPNVWVIRYDAPYAGMTLTKVGDPSGVSNDMPAVEMTQGGGFPPYVYVAEPPEFAPPFPVILTGKRIVELSYYSAFNTGGVTLAVPSDQTLNVVVNNL